MDIQKTLQEFGLSEREAEMYLTLLQIGEGSILDIAKNSTLKRPTIYTSIESLESKGLIHRIFKGKRVRYKPEPPKTLEILLKNKEKQLYEVLPQLEALLNVPRGTKPNIRYFEGKQAVLSLYRSTFAQLAERDEILLFSSIRDLLISFPEMMDTFDKTAIRWQWKVREIIPQNKASVEYLQNSNRSAQKNIRHQTRLLPKGLDLFDSEVLLLRDSLIIISLQKDVFAILIQSQHIVESFRSIFQAAWMISMPHQ